MAQDDARTPQTGEMSAASLIERAADRLRRTSQPPGRECAPVHRADRDAPETGRRVRIDLERLAAAGFLTPERMRSRLAEEMRMIKRSIVQTFWHRGVDRSNMIMVTSAFPGEGKSFTALNLAISLACEIDFHVLLVDADFACPKLMERLGLPPHAGLMDVLKDTVRDIGEVILHTDIERLSIIGPGRDDDMSSELLASNRMQRLAAEIADRYPDRLILFDAPPLLACSEPAVLAEHVGQVVLVVEADTTPREMVRAAIGRLPDTCAVGLVLNKSRSGFGGNQYPYYRYRHDADGPNHS